MKITKEMKKSKFSIAQKDDALAELVSNTDHKILATWAIDCVEHVMPYFEENTRKTIAPGKPSTLMPMLP